jgi:hypothetical protein
MRHLLSTIRTVCIFNVLRRYNIAKSHLTGSYFQLYVFLRKGMLVLNGVSCIISHKLNLQDGIPDDPSYIHCAFVFKDNLLALDPFFRLKKI